MAELKWMTDRRSFASRCSCNVLGTIPATVLYIYITYKRILGDVCLRWNLCTQTTFHKKRATLIIEDNTAAAFTNNVRKSGKSPSKGFTQCHYVFPTCPTFQHGCVGWIHFCIPLLFPPMPGENGKPKATDPHLRRRWWPCQRSLLSLVNFDLDEKASSIRNTV